MKDDWNYLFKKLQNPISISLSQLGTNRTLYFLGWLFMYVDTDGCKLWNDVYDIRSAFLFVSYIDTIYTVQG